MWKDVIAPAVRTALKRLWLSARRFLHRAIFPAIVALLAAVTLSWLTPPLEQMVDQVVDRLSPGQVGVVAAWALFLIFFVMRPVIELVREPRVEVVRESPARIAESMTGWWNPVDPEMREILAARAIASTDMDDFTSWSIMRSPAGSSAVKFIVEHADELRAEYDRVEVTDLRRTAMHEARHAVVAVASGATVILATAGHGSGMVRSVTDPSKSSVDRFWDSLLISAAGMIGDPSQGCLSDGNQAVAQATVIQLSGERPVGYLGEMTVPALLAGAREAAESICAAHAEQVSAFADELASRRSLRGENLRDAIAKLGLPSGLGGSAEAPVHAVDVVHN